MREQPSGSLAAVSLPNGSLIAPSCGSTENVCRSHSSAARSLIAICALSWLWQEHSLVCAHPTFTYVSTNFYSPVLRSSKTSPVYVRQGRPSWSTSILTSGTSINKTVATSFRPSSSNFLLSLVLAATSSPAYILHTMMVHRSPAIVP
jgi:hypothetical protein